MKIKLFTLLAISISTVANANALNINSIESNFRQVITNEENAKVSYSGKLYAKKDTNKALWEYQTPVVKKIYYTGDGKLVIIEPELEQVIYAKLHKIPNILKLLKDAKKSKDGRLTTRFNGIDYTIKTDGDLLSSVSYIDEMQNRVTITFSNEKININIPNSKFSYTIPSGYDILEQ